MYLTEKDFTSTKKSKSLYFDTKHYTLSPENVIKWAKTNNKVIEIPLIDFLKLTEYGESSDELTEIFGNYLGQGAESLAFKNEKTDKVFKIIYDGGFKENPWEIVKDKIVRHNRVFPETAYKISNVVHVPWDQGKKKILASKDKDLIFLLNTHEKISVIPESKFWPVLCQDILDTNNIEDNILHYSHNNKETVIDKFLKDKGFKQLNRTIFPGDRTYKKGRTFISDVHKGNIGRDKEGNYKIFDAILDINLHDFD
jgi:hypothetical protein